MNPRARFALITLATLLGISLTTSLGFWQLNRADQKQALQASMDAPGNSRLVDSRSLLAAADPASLQYQHASLTGQWLAEQTLYLDNRQMNDKQGLYVVTPLQLEGGPIVLVQRGWVARNFIDRSSLPVLQSPPGLLEIEGRIAAVPSRLYQFGGAETGRIRQNLDLAAFSAESGLALLPVSVQQTGAASDGLLREWPQAGAGVETHYGYAFQWFALSALITALYVWFQIVRRFIPHRRA